MKLNNKTKSQGVIYVATGKKYIEEAINSVASLKANMPDLSVTAFFDQKIESLCFDDLVVLENAHYSFRDKIMYMSRSPYEKTLFLDTDTYVCDKIPELFILLDKFDIALAHAPYREIMPIPGVPNSFPEFNSGVILFKKSPSVINCFENWLSFYDQDVNAKRKWMEPASQELRLLHDQPALRKALYNSSLRMATLTPEYNCRFNMPGYVHGKVKILHGRHPDILGVAKVINGTVGQRLHILRLNTLKIIDNSRKLNPLKYWLFRINSLIQAGNYLGIILGLNRTIIKNLKKIFTHT